MHDELHNDPNGNIVHPHVGPEIDPAEQSLGDALRVSFRLLAVIMIFVAGGFMLTGFKSIEPQQIGIKRVFGKIVGTVESGLAYTWPFPVGKIEIVNTSEQTLTVEDFWMNETPADRTKKLTERFPAAAGLRPGWDGALLTGDLNLLHIKMTCNYSVQGPEGAKIYRQSIDDLESTIRAVVCRAAILAGATRTADSIQRRGKSAFAEEVRKRAQRQLNNLTMLGSRPFEAVRINAIVVGKDSTWPLGALPAYLAAQRAISEREELRNQAIADARKILNEAAGASHEILVGSPERFMGVQVSSSSRRDPNERPHDLIGQFTTQSDSTKADQLLQQIEQILLSNATGGEASKIIADAKAYKTQRIQNAESRAKRFNDLLPEFEKAPQFMLERLWADVRDEILDSPTIEKFYLTVNDGKTILKINRDPDVSKAIRREQLKIKKANPEKP